MVANIQDSGWPLAFAAESGAIAHNRIVPGPSPLNIRTSVRALEGMQKEALVDVGGERVWRMACDEGPWLNGTDLAPFPLGFFGAGIVASFMSAVVAEAQSRGVTIESLATSVDFRFTMEGSALQGTMQAGLEPTQCEIGIAGDASDDELRDICEIAVTDRAVAEAVLASALPSRFAIRGNGEAIDHSLFSAESMRSIAEPMPNFLATQPTTPDAQPGIIAKTETLTGDTGSAVGLQSDQKRIVHVNAAGRLRPDGQKSIVARCVQPASSAFQFLSDNSALVGGLERSPSGLAYLSAGVAFCFMTQLGRYAQIAKLNLAGYRIVQDTSFDRIDGYGPTAAAVETLAFVDGRESDEHFAQLVTMGEQTCYLHGAYRLAHPTGLSIRI